MKKNIFLFLLSVLVTFKGYSFDLKTHLWLAQQLLNDVIKNKSITLNGKQYKLNDQVYSALVNHPSEFRIGTLGIDVFPDPVVGQITAHPGLVNGWKTDDWIQHVLNSAESPAEIAFAYGYACHAAMDIFAHTYVNAYSGDIFLLTDNEVAVERRHFALEKYIGNHIPPIITDDGRTITDNSALISGPHDFLSRTFILNNKVTDQYVKSGSLHLVAMNGVYNVVQKMDAANQSVVGFLGAKYLEYLKEQYRFVLELDKKVGLTAQAGLQLKLAKEALDIKIAANKILLEKIRIERDIINKGIEAKKTIESFIQLKHTFIADANGLLHNLENEIIDKEAQILKLGADIALLPLTVAKTIVEEITKWIPAIPYPCGIKTCHGPFGVPYPCPKICNTKLITELITRVIQVVNPAIGQLTRSKNDLIDRVANAKKQITATKADVVNAANDIAKKTEELTNLATNIALAEANELNYKTQKGLLEKEIEVLQRAYDEAKKIYETVKREEDDLRGRLEAYADQFINVAKKLIEKYNLVHLLLKNWQGDIEKASKNYIIAGEKFAKDVLSANGNGFSHYQDWFKCWAPVFTAIPSQIPQAACVLEDYYTKIRSEIDELLEQLGPLQYLLDPTKKLRELLMQEVKEKAEYAAIQISNHLFGAQTTDFFLMITGREAVTTPKLIGIFREDGSGKNLVSFPDVTLVINKEMGLANDGEMIGIDKFATLHNALQLSKLAVLPGQSLNTIYTDYAGNGRTDYGRTLYPNSDNSRFTILNKAVSSIDGSSQWMHTSVPIYRDKGFDNKWPNDRQYGYSQCQDDESGFRFWVDKTARKKIFPVLFRGPLTPELYAYASYNADNRLFIPCAENPFPNTETDNCNILGSNTFCKDRGLKRFFKKLFGKY